MRHLKQMVYSPRGEIQMFLAILGFILGMCCGIDYIFSAPKIPFGVAVIILAATSGGGFSLMLLLSESDTGMGLVGLSSIVVFVGIFGLKFMNYFWSLELNKN